MACRIWFRLSLPIIRASSNLEQFNPIMKLTQHLDRIYQLVLDRADPAKVREHVELIRDQVDASDTVQANLRKQLVRNKKSYKKEIIEVNQANAKELAKLRNANLMLYRLTQH